jgi:FKBP-type peptidyl-prolyl cis-trans isomerase FkpA
LKKKFTGFCALATAILCASACAYAADEPKADAKAEPKKAEETASPFKTPKEKLSYALGMSIAKGLKEAEVEIDATLVAQAMNDVLGGKKPLMTEQEFGETLRSMQQEVAAKRMKAMQEARDASTKKNAAGTPPAPVEKAAPK